MKEFLEKYGIQLALILSVVGILQHWFILLVKHLLFKGKVDIYEIGNLEIGYCELGPTIGMNGTLRAINNDMFIRRIKIAVTNLKEGSVHEFEWDVFRSRKISAGKEEHTSMESASGFLLPTHTPRHIDVQFHDVELLAEMRQQFFEVHSTWANLITSLSPDDRAQKEKEVEEGKDPYKELFDEFRENEIYTRALENLQRLCYWKPGDYSVKAVVQTARPAKSFEKESSFSLTGEDVDAIRLNAEKLMHDICNRPTPHSYFFAYPKYKNLTLM